MPDSSRRKATVTVPPLIAASQPQAPSRRTATGMLLRFISCGLLALALTLVWRLTIAPPTIGPGTALFGIFSLLLGFIAGGVGWYLLDARRRARHPDSVSDERLVFSFVVFAVVPFLVLLLVGLVWLVALFI
ncbi:MAG: hypothetical protein ACYDAC_02045 [Candidatus Dormibacteria bacterium]